MLLVTACGALAFAASPVVVLVSVSLGRMTFVLVTAPLLVLLLLLPPVVMLAGTVAFNVEGTDKPLATKVEIAGYECVSTEVLLTCGSKLATGMTVVWFAASGKSVSVIIRAELELFRGDSVLVMVLIDVASAAPVGFHGPSQKISVHITLPLLVLKPTDDGSLVAEYSTTFVKSVLCRVVVITFVTVTVVKLECILVTIEDVDSLAVACVCQQCSLPV